MAGPVKLPTTTGPGVSASSGHVSPPSADMATKFLPVLTALAVSCFASTDMHHTILCRTSISRIAFRYWVESKSSDVVDSHAEIKDLVKIYDSSESKTCDKLLRAEPCCTMADHTDTASWCNCMHLRGGAANQVLPTAGPPAEDGKLRACAQCGALETRVTLGHCKITQLFFCARTECRRQHWKANEAFWRELAAKVHEHVFR
jgi:hypothetical protein